MRPRPDPLQRLALLRNDGLTLVVDLPAGTSEGEEKRADPSVEAAEVVQVVEAVAGADPVPDEDDRHPDTSTMSRHRTAGRRTAGGTPPHQVGGPDDPERDLLTGPPDPVVPVDGSDAIRQGVPTVSRAGGRHRHRREGAPARTEVGDLPTRGDDIHRMEALSAFGGWVPDDEGGAWEGYDGPEPQVRGTFRSERRAWTRHRADGGDDGADGERVDDERTSAGSSSRVDVDHTDDVQRDDSAGDSRTRSDVDRVDGRGGDSGRDEPGGDDSGDDSGGDGSDDDGSDGDGDDGDGDDRADSDEPEVPRIRARRLGNRPWGRLAELWVPESLRDARVDPGRRGLLVLLLVAAVAAVATAIGVWRDRPEPRPVETVALAPASDGSELAALAAVANAADPSSGAPPISGAVPISGTAAIAGTGAAIASTASPTEIVVSVTGLVAHPGVVTLPAGARVTDAIAAAGGSTEEADLTGLNLAAKLADGDSVVIAGQAAVAGNSGVSSTGSVHSPSSGNQAVSTDQQESSPLIDLNSADEGALDSLPGVGPVMAQNILAWRQQNGRFSSVEQLQEISGIGPARYAQISALVTVS